MRGTVRKRAEMSGCGMARSSLCTASSILLQKSERAHLIHDVHNVAPLLLSLPHLPKIATLLLQQFPFLESLTLVYHSLATPLQ